MWEDEVEATGFHFTQVKQKFGGLRIYTSGKQTESMREALDAAMTRASETCEDCGQIGSLRTEEWLRVQCDECDRRYSRMREERNMRFKKRKAEVAARTSVDEC